MARLWLLTACLAGVIWVAAGAVTLEATFPPNGPACGSTYVSGFVSGVVQATSKSSPQCKFGSKVVPGSVAICREAIRDATQRLLDAKLKTMLDDYCIVCASSGLYQADGVTEKTGSVEVKFTLDGSFTDLASPAKHSFSYYLTPRISKIHPRFGPHDGGTVVEITGKNFQKSEMFLCSFGPGQVQVASYASSTKAYCTAPASEMTLVPITIGVTLNRVDYSNSPDLWYYYQQPFIEKLLPSKGPLLGGNAVTIKGNRFNPFLPIGINNTMETLCRFGSTIMQATIQSNELLVCTAPPSDVAHTVEVQVTLNGASLDNNADDWTKSVQYLYYNPPYVFSVEPAYGPASGNTLLVVRGAAFIDAQDLKVMFNGTAGLHPVHNVAVAQYIGPHEIRVKTPVLAPGVYTITVSASDTLFASHTITYVAYGTPTIARLEPPCGPVEGQTQVAVHGSNFVRTGLNMVKCKFGTVESYATVISTTLIYCGAPSVAAAANVPVTVTLNGQDYHGPTTPVKYTYYIAPKLDTISPKSGPIAGGTTVTLSGSGFSGACVPSCRFGTHQVPATVVSNTRATCVSPTSEIPDDLPVQFAPNQQDFVAGNETAHDTMFRFYKNPLVTSFFPASGPTVGGTPVTITGVGFNAVAKLAVVATQTKCRFSKGTVKLAVSASAVTAGYVVCPAPAWAAAASGVAIAVALNGADFYEITSTGKTFAYFVAPTVTSVSPLWGPTSATDREITVAGTNFACNEPSGSTCPHLKCRFGNPPDAVVVEAISDSTTKLRCKVPPISRPEIVPVEITINDYDYTRNGHTYGYFNAFLLQLVPRTGPESGSTIVTRGYGFVQSGTANLKCKLVNPDPAAGIVCANHAGCIYQATFKSGTELSCPIPARADVQDSAGNFLKSFIVEVSVDAADGKHYTTNGLRFEYYEQPSILSVQPLRGPISGDTYVVMEANFHMPPNVPARQFNDIKCRFKGASATKYSEGHFIEMTVNEVVHRSIRCLTPQYPTPEVVQMSFAVNGHDYVANAAQTFTFFAEAHVATVSPGCGPTSGSTVVSVTGNDFATKVVDVAFDAFDIVPYNAKAGSLSFNTPDLGMSTWGGTSYVEVSVNEVDLLGTEYMIDFTDDHKMFKFYKQPSIAEISPHSGLTSGGSIVTLEGAYFRQLYELGCKLECKFGTVYSAANFLSPVRVECPVPKQTFAAGSNMRVELGITINRQNLGSAMQFQYFNKPTVTSIKPVTGPATGATLITIYGTNFANTKDLNELFCKFGDVKVPADYVSPTQLHCVAPPLSGSDMVTKLEVTLNDHDYTSNGKAYTYYQITRVLPRSAPAEATSITIYGTGFTKTGLVKCVLGEETFAPTSIEWDRVVCPKPVTLAGTDRTFQVTLNGEEFPILVSKFHTYKQITVSSVTPAVGPARGLNPVHFIGADFEKFNGWDARCLIGELEGTVQLITSTDMLCVAPKDMPPTDAPLVAQLSLNGHDYVKAPQAYKIYSLQDVTPHSFPASGDAVVTLHGTGYSKELAQEGYCRFGTGNSAVFQKVEYVSSTELKCRTPKIAAEKVAAGKTSQSVVSLTLNGQDSHAFTKDQKITYYSQPLIRRILPSRAPLGKSVNVTVEAYKDALFPASLSDSINCKWGDLASTKGYLQDPSHIICPTPALGALELPSGHANVRLEIAMNGQDHTSGDLHRDPESRKFQFGDSGMGFLAILGIIIGVICGAAVLYVGGKAGLAAYQRYAATQASRAQMRPQRQFDEEQMAYIPSTNSAVPERERTVQMATFQRPAPSFPFRPSNLGGLSPSAPRPAV